MLVILTKDTLKLQKATKNIGYNLNTKNTKGIVTNFYFKNLRLFQKFIYLRNIKLNVMGKRKTISVKDMVDYANLQLSRTDEIATKDFKIGICVMIEKYFLRIGVNTEKVLVILEIDKWRNMVIC